MIPLLSLQLAQNSPEYINPILLEAIKGTDAATLLETAMWFVRSLSSNNVFDMDFDSLESLLFRHCEKDTEAEVNLLLCRKEVRDLFKETSASKLGNPSLTVPEALSSIMALVEKVQPSAENLLTTTFTKTAAHYQRRMLQT